MARSMLHWSRDCCWSRVATLLFLSASLLLHSASAQLNNDTSPTHVFRSRPDLHAPIIDFKILRPELVTPGYIFMAPYRNKDPGPYIYDNFGNLVWSGAGEGGPKTAHAPHTCEYKGETHLCFFQGEQHQGFARGFGTIMNQNYRVVKTIESNGAGASSDMHEFRMTPFSSGTTTLMTIYQPRMFDLSTNPRYKVQGGMGWIVEGVFQEVDIETGRVVFEWRSTDHIDPSLSHVYPGTTDTSGNGLREDTPWDYFHINSIDKNVEGDYLISARHTSGIYKLSGVDGHIIWELGGSNPTFNQTNFRFSSQHHARFVSENKTHTLLTMFDNASNSYKITHAHSLGYLICINHIDNTATAIKSWTAPEKSGGLLSGSQGNMQMLPGGNVHIGWGEHALFSEHTEGGSAVMYGQLADRASNVMIYRSYKFNWTGTPVTKPSLWTYANHQDSPEGMAFYVSWNGATEVAAWRFYVGETSSGPFEMIASVDKTGFETVFRDSQVQGWSFAEAVDANGRALERSMIAKTFIPSDALRPFCDEWACGKADKDKGPDDEEEKKEDAEALRQFRLDFWRLSPQRGFNTSKYYADVPGEEPISSTTIIGTTPAAKKVQLSSLVLGVGVSVMFGVAVGISLYLIRRMMTAGVRPLNDTFHEKMEAVRRSWENSSISSKLGAYARVPEEEDKQLPS